MTQDNWEVKREEGWEQLVSLFWGFRVEDKGDGCLDCSTVW